MNQWIQHITIPTSWSTWTCHFHWGGLLVQLFSPSWGLNRAMALQSRRWCNRRLQNEDHQGFKQHGSITEDHGKEDTHVFQIEVATVTVNGVNENLFNSEYTALEETPKQNTHRSLRFNHREGTAGSFKRPFFCKDPLAAFIALHSLYLSTLFWASKQFEVLMSDPTGVYRNGVIPATDLQL